MSVFNRMCKCGHDENHHAFSFPDYSEPFSWCKIEGCNCHDFQNAKYEPKKFKCPHCGKEL